MSIDAAHRALQWMPAMQDWAILSLLVCPSKLVIVRGLQVPGRYKHDVNIVAACRPVQAMISLAWLNKPECLTFV